ncbi:MAG: B12-binding domain-containing radical SAM protein [Patescibacteria group bacterium]|nr:B12-binding domain-containing radical SAM protein [Patescibacteria group bacterium]
MEPKVLLVYPPNQLMPVELPRPDGSLGPLYLAGALERAGIEVDVLDASVGTPDDSLETTFNNRVLQSNGLIRIGMTAERISEVISNGGYNVVGVNSNFTPQTKMALEVARLAKGVSEDILVVAGGVNARALPGRFLAGGVDVVCATEGERIIVELARRLEEGRNLEVSGTITTKRGIVVRHPLRAGDTVTNLDELPFPTWQKLPFEQYDGIASAGRDSLKQNERSASLMTSRGCPFRCAYCHISMEKQNEKESGGIGALRTKSVSRVMEEVKCLKALGVKKIYFEDDSLLAHKSRVKEIFTKVTGMGMKIADVNGVNLTHFLKGGPGGKPMIDVEYLELLASAGFDQIVFPVESASQRILNKYATGKLNHAKLDVVELVKLAVRIGITCPVNMMIGFPDETEEEILSSIELGRRLVDAGAPYCSLYVPIPFPGSQLHEIALHDGYLASNFDTDAFNWRKPTMRDTTVSPERIEELQQWGWRDINPKEYVRKRLEMDIGRRWKSGEPEVA